MSVIWKIYSIIKNLPAIIAIIDQLISLIKPLVGETGVDEVEQVQAVKRKMADLGDRAGIKDAKEKLFELR